MTPDSDRETESPVPPLPPARPVTDAESLTSQVAGERGLPYVEVGLVEAASAAAVRWAGLGRLRELPNRLVDGAVGGNAE